jgi:pimeloyl-ACP methyl ester carboxylesterase
VRLPGGRQLSFEVGGDPHGYPVIGWHGQDVLAVADAMGFERFGVIGGSGGGPHALACAALLPHRVERAACLSGLAPLGSHGLPRDVWLAGMDSDSAGRCLAAPGHPA